MKDQDVQRPIRKQSTGRTETRFGKLSQKRSPQKYLLDKVYQNAVKNSDKQNAGIEHDKALQRVIIELPSDDTELFKRFSDNSSFKKWLGDSIFAATYQVFFRRFV